MIQTINTTKTATHKAILASLGVVVLGASMGLTMGGCRGDRTDKPPRQFFPDMDDQPKLKAQSESKFFEDGQAQRLPVDGVVAFGSNPVVPQTDEQAQQAWGEMYAKDRDDMLKGDETYYFGLVSGSAGEETPRYTHRMPVEVTQELIERGQERFNIYCAMCHGYDAIGNDSGTVGRLMNVRPVNLLDDKYRDRAGEFGSDGYLFHIIREGLWSPDGTNRMPAYGHAVNEQDAWAIVSYIRTLQAAFDSTGKSTVNQVSQSQPKDIEHPIAQTKVGGEG